MVSFNIPRLELYIPFFNAINALFQIWNRKITKPERFLEFLTSVSPVYVWMYAFLWKLLFF